MSVTRAEVVMVDWPFSDRAGSMVRPGVVVQADFLNSLIDDTVLFSITRRSRGAAAVEVVIDPAVETASGLPHLSVAVCNNFLTLDQTQIRRTVGQLSGATMQKIADCLKTALGMP
jgi:mRNA-degrading endonuclease toxin of MazEF toxin-antitoxin module